MATNVSAYEFERLIRDVLERSLEGFAIETPPVGADGGVDIVARRGKETILYEVKALTPQTRSRINAVAEQLKRNEEKFKKRYPQDRPPKLVLVVSIVLAPQHIEFLASQNIEVIDGAEVARLAAGHGLQYEAVRVLGNLPADQQTQEAARRAANINVSDRLVKELGETQCGRSDWVKFQKLCRDILEFLFCPPLEQPITENFAQLSSNRRDIILPNYCMDGFFAYLRVVYQAHLVTFDAKNSCNGISKDDVLQMSNYLSDKGLGLFGVLIGRTGPDVSAINTRRDHWTGLQGKMIIFLEDSDLRQMIQDKIDGKDPSVVLRQKIEDFRLSV
ncbi:restriction endonuclease [Nonomuraea antimicrobica]|uniref:restriction endonuclease n=1 Tax=Nonomuraea antimicrobica TaxID=561173 RepID=UPI0031E52118